jgi:hypothetical protein
MKSEIARKFLAVCRGTARPELYGQTSGRGMTVECESRVRDTIRHEICDWRNSFPLSAVWNGFSAGHVCASYHYRESQQG